MAKAVEKPVVNSAIYAFYQVKTKQVVYSFKPILDVSLSIPRRRLSHHANSA